jgi:hypothetical protein
LKKSVAVTLAVLFAALILVPLGCTTNAASSKGEQLLTQAQQQASQANYTKAAKLYQQAFPLLVKQGLTAKAAQCQDGLQTADLYLMTYGLTAKQLKEGLAQAYPQVAEAVRQKWITSGEVEHKKIDGTTMYFVQAADNIPYRHLDIMLNDPKKQAGYEPLLNAFMKNVVTAPAPSSSQPYSNPATWTGTNTLTIPASELPKTGVMKIWFPVPIQTGPQQPVSMGAVSGFTLKQPPSQSQDIGMAYTEVQLGSLNGDFNATINYTFTHYEQRFTVNPANVGTYNKSSSEYKQYTRSYGNTKITPDIKKTAQKVVGTEKNPYLQAKKLYDYVVKDIKYSFMPHSTLWPRGEAESVYVHTMKRGDCGAQSMYFAALCRSLGIMARTPGGYQLFSGNFGSHFWAEFFLPNYGWIPVDPTAAELGDYVKSWSPETVKTFKDFYFGGQDNTRCIVQNDVDEPLVPPTALQPMLPAAIQDPVVTCDSVADPIGLPAIEGWKMNAVRQP